MSSIFIHGLCLILTAVHWYENTFCTKSQTSQIKRVVSQNNTHFAQDKEMSWPCLVWFNLIVSRRSRLLVTQNHLWRRHLKPDKNHVDSVSALKQHLAGERTSHLFDPFITTVKGKRAKTHRPRRETFCVLCPASLSGSILVTNPDPTIYASTDVTVSASSFHVLVVKQYIH